MLRAACLLAVALCALPLHAAPSMPARVLDTAEALSPEWRAPRLQAVEVARLPALLQKAVAVDEGGRVRVGPVRAIESMSRPLAWIPQAGGFVARFRVVSEGAAGLRVKLSLGAVPGAFELRATGDGGGIETQLVDPWLGPEAWGPWTEGSAQEIELFSRVRPSEGAVTVTAVVHAAASPLAKASASTCTIPTMCPTGDPVIDEAVAVTKKAVARLSFVEGSFGYYCTGTLINTELFPAAYLFTANHCISTQAVAASLTTLWFYENSGCTATGATPGKAQVGGGASVVMTSYSVDSSLLLMNFPPPQGAVYSSWSAAPLANGTAFVSLSHPQGDTSRIARGTVVGEHRFGDYPQDMHLVKFSSGLTEGGSSGSGLFVLNGTSLELRSLLFGGVGTVDGTNCAATNDSKLGIYGHLDVFGPQIAPYLTSAGRAADDAPNRIAELAAGIDAPLDTLANGLTFARALDYAGDVDVFRFSLATSATVAAWTEGPNLDTVGTLLDSEGRALESNDDAQVSSNHFGITRRLGPGTYHVQVEHYRPEGTGAYTARIKAYAVDATNYTNLWWNPFEPGWGLNVNHQGNTLFATLFTYDRDGTPMWLVMSNGARQADGSFSGTLYRTRGPAFNARPWGAISLTPAGTMTLRFTDARTGSLEYTYDGTRVTRAIQVQAFGSPIPTCTWSAFDRSFNRHLQDLWWNPNESGWGVNVAQQGDTVFATLFTYDASGKGAWYVMSKGALNANQTGFSGTLYRTSGRSFDSTPWVPVTVTPVGTMQGDASNTGNAMLLSFTIDGVTVVKDVQRQVFGDLRPDCGS